MVAAGVLSVGLLLGPRIAMARMLVQQENRVQQEIVGFISTISPACASRPISNITLAKA